MKHNSDPFGELDKSKSEVTLECRVKPSNWWGIVFFLVMACLPLALVEFVPRPPASPNAGSDLPIYIFLGCVAAFWVGFAIWFGIQIGYFRIIATDTGLEWRNFRQWRKVPWHDVQEFYKRTETGSSCAVVTSAGTFTFDNSLDNYLELCRRIQNCALQGKAKWGLRGTQLQPNECATFTVQVKFIRWLLALSLLLPLLFLAMFVSGRISRGTPGLSIWWVIAATGLGLGSMLLYSLLPLIMLYPTYRATRQHRDERLTVTNESLRQDSVRGTVTLPWEEILEFNVFQDDRIGHNTTLTLKTRKDVLTIVPQAFANPERLARLIEQSVPESAARIKTSWDDPVLLATPTLGVKTFNYRNRTARATALGLSVITLSLPLIQTLDYLGLGRRSAGSIDPTMVTITVLLAVLILYGWCCYYWSSIEMDDTGMTHYSPLRTVRLGWEEIENWTHNQYYITISGKSGAIRIGPLGNLDDLKTEIYRRAPKLV